jgi:NADPH:quinone reductase-like Zn-dependent oxidoreductase
VRATFFIVEPDRRQLSRLAELVDAGRLHVTIADTYPLARGPEAFEQGRQSHRPGKTVLTVTNS